MEITLNNIDRIFNSLDDIKVNTVYEIDLDCIYDAGLNPREIDIKYAEEISLNIPPIIVGIIKESPIKKFAIIDGNHRYYNRSQIEKTKTIPAFIRVYKNETSAFIDAYKANLEHGKRLTDREELKGMQRIIGYLKEENPYIAYTEIAEMINLPFQRVSEYISWIEVNKALGKEIVKWKAQKLAFLLKKDDNGNTLKKFWELNSNLAKPDLLKAIKLYRGNGEIVDYKTIKVKELLNNNNFDDGLRTRAEEKISSLSTGIENIEKIKENNNNENEEKLEEDNIEKRFSNLKDEPEDEIITNEKDNIFNKKELIDIDIKEEEFEYTEDDDIPTESIPVSKEKETKSNDLVALDGYQRFYKFETIANRFFDNITEELLTNANEFKNLVNNNINNNNKESYDKMKSQLRGKIKNMELILKNLLEFINE